MSASRARSGGTPETAATGRRAARLVLTPIAVAVLAAVGASAALAFWALPGGGGTATDAGDLPAPTGLTASSVPGSGVVSVGWDPVTAPDGGAVDGYVVERLQGSVRMQACGSSIVSPLPAAPTTCADTVSTAGVYTYRVTALFRSWSAESASSPPVNVILDITPPSVVSVTRAGATPTSAATVAWTVTFSEPVTGVDTADFALVQGGGLAGSTLVGVTGSGTTYTVAASIGAPAGTLRLDLVDDDTILDTAPNPLGGAGVGNGDQAGQAYVVDTTAPTTPALTLSGAIGHTFLAGTTAYVNAQGLHGGGFTVTAATTDPDTGVASVAFPFPAGFSAGGGVDTAAPYATDYAWSGAVGASGAYAVTATNGAGGSSSADVTIVPDTSPPAGGSLTVNGGGARSTGSTTTIDSSPFAEALSPTASGIAQNSVTREFADLTADTCGAFSSVTAVTDNGFDTGLVTGCYRYTLTGTDHVGNWAEVEQTLRVDTSAPTGPVLTLTEATAGPDDGMAVAGSTIYVRGAAGVSGQFDVAATTDDPDTGVLDVTFPTLAGITGGGADAAAPYATTYSWSGPLSVTGAQTVVARNLATGQSTASFTVVSDTAPPTGGTLTVNGGGAYSTSGTVAIASTPFAETASPTASGLSSSTLVRESATLAANACGAFGGPVAVAAPSDGPLAAGCYRYRLTGTDNVGNVATIEQVVKVDTSAPTLPALTLTAPTGNTFVAGTTAYVSALAGRSGSFTVGAAPTDAETGILDVAFPALPGFTSGGGTDPLVPFSSTYTWSGIAAAGAVGARTVTARNPVLLAASGAFSVVNDTTSPAGGTLTVNGVNGTTGGSTSTSTSGTYSVASNPYGESLSATASGLAASTLTRAVSTAPVSGSCASYGADEAFAGTSESGLALGCYRYVLTGADNVGNTASRTTTVLVAPVRVTAIATAGGSAVSIAGTARWGGGNVTVIVCRTSTYPNCRAANRAYRNRTVAVGTDYTWSVPSTGALTGATTYYVWATQGGTRSEQVTFPPLPYTAP